MLKAQGRNAAGKATRVAEGWAIHRLAPASRLFGANGMRTGADGRIYVAQVAGSQISAVDPDTGEVEVISPMGGPIVGPDDLTFDEHGNLYATEITEGRVTMLSPNGESRVILGDTPVANPITYHQGRLISGECRVGGRVMELDRDGGAPRIILDNVPMPNAFEVGPDGKLYMPIMGTNEIWRVSLDGGEPEVVATDLGLPDSVKFDPQGFIVSTQVASGQVLRVDPRTGEKSILADIAPGLDNCTFVGDRLFISRITGQLDEIVEPGKLRSVIPSGLQWPLDVAIGADGVLFIVDGGFTYSLREGEAMKLEGMLFTPNFPGYSRGADVAASGEFVLTTANGEVTRWLPASAESEVLTSGYDQLMAVQIAPNGAIVFAEYGTGRVHSLEGGTASVLASGLAQPKGVAIGADGAIYVSEAAGGRVVKLSGGRAETVLDSLDKPEGIAVCGEKLFVLDIGTKELIEYDLSGKTRQTIASGLPVGAPEGANPTPLGGVGDMCGPMGNFTGIDVAADGTIYVCGDLEGSVLVLRKA